MRLGQKRGQRIALYFQISQYRAQILEKPPQLKYDGQEIYEDESLCEDLHKGNMNLKIIKAGFMCTGTDLHLPTLHAKNH
jgi:hypothetical protein